MTKMKHFHKKRLLKLAAFLDKLPRKKFNFASWVSGVSPEHPCGTAACAVGYCPVVFPKDWKYTKLKIDLVTFDGKELYTSKPALKGRSNDYPEYLAAKYFGISNEDAYGLFVHGPDPLATPSYKITPKQIARHIRKFLKEKEKATQ